MNKVNCYWIIDVRSGRKSGYSFAEKLWNRKKIGRVILHAI